MHQNIFNKNWDFVKNEIHKHWSHISTEELDRTHGDTEALTDLVQRKCGLSEEEAEHQVDEIIEKAAVPLAENAEEFRRENELRWEGRPVDASHVKSEIGDELSMDILKENSF